MTKQRKPTQLRSQKRVALILDSAVEVLRTRGIGAVTTNSIAEQAAIPVSSIYQYFPNKIAILSALYKDYLSGIVSVLDELGDIDHSNNDWEVVMTELVEAIQRQETRDDIDQQLEIALGLYPELVEIDHEHRAVVADRLADLLQRLGSRWSKPRLRRLGYFIYEIDGAIWRYRSLDKSSNKEIMDWSRSTLLNIVRQCM